MTRNIDRLADSRTDTASPGEQFQNKFLKARPRSEWAPFIDEIAYDKAWDPERMSIGNVGLTESEFGRELGEYYRTGLEQLSGEVGGLPRGIEQQDVGPSRIGDLAYQLAKLGVEIERSDDAIDDLPRAIEILVEKLLFQLSEEPRFSPAVSEATSIASLVLDLFDDPTFAEVHGSIRSKLDETPDLLTLIDRPVMTTRLWPHQREAIENWLEADCRGFADMATATGKTVLGLAAIAHRYGQLHPTDRELLPDDPAANSSNGESVTPDEILIVAHTNPVIEQWHREFDKHLNVPEDRTAQGDVVTLEWGKIHFKLAQNVEEVSLSGFDLVLLDEAHHYASGSEWRSILQGVNGDLLALTGSVDDTSEQATDVRRRLEEHAGEEIQRYTVADARADGIIPTFDWSVLYTDFHGRGVDLARLTEECESLYHTVRERFESGDLSLGDDERTPSLRTFEDVRIAANLTEEGRRLKSNDPEFRELASKLNARQSKMVNETPRIKAVLDIAERHRDEKLIVLTSKNAETDEVERRFRESDHWDDDDVFVLRSGEDRADQIDEVEEYNGADAPAVVVGTGDLLGEGVNTKTAEVGINLATGTVTRDFIQRMGRVLRNPSAIDRSSGESLVDDHPHAFDSEKKRARFYNIVGIPKDDNLRVDREDGISFIENAIDFLGFGERIDELPTFAASTPRAEWAVADLEKEGAIRVDTLRSEGNYEPPESEVEKRFFEKILRNVAASEWNSYLLSEWGMSDADQPNVGEVGHVVDPLETFDETVSADGPGTPGEEVGTRAERGSRESDAAETNQQDERQRADDRSRTSERDASSGDEPTPTRKPEETRASDDATVENDTADASQEGWRTVSVVVQSVTGERLSGARVRLEANDRIYYVELTTGEDGRVQMWYPSLVRELDVSVDFDGFESVSIPFDAASNPGDAQLIVPLPTIE